MKTRRVARAALIAAALIIQTPAHAGAMAGGATEVTQILNNIQLLMQSITEEMQYVTQVEQLAVQTLQQIPGSDTSLLADIRKTSGLVNSARGAMNSLDNLHSELGSLETHATQRYRNFVASGLTWADYVAREKQIAATDRKRAKILSQAEESAMQRVKETWDSYQRYQQEIRTSQGEHQSLRTLNGQMNSLLGTMNTVLNLSAVRSNAETERDFKQSLREDEELSRIQKIQEERLKNNQYGKEQLRRLQSL